MEIEQYNQYAILLATSSKKFSFAEDQKQCFFFFSREGFPIGVPHSVVNSFKIAIFLIGTQEELVRIINFIGRDI